MSRDPAQSPRLPGIRTIRLALPVTGTGVPSLGLAADTVADTVADIVADTVADIIRKPARGDTR